MEKQGNELLTFFSASKTSKDTGILLTFVRGEKPNREFFKAFVPFWDITKGKEPAAHFHSNKPTIMSLREEPKSKAKGNEVGPMPEWCEELPL